MEKKRHITNYSFLCPENRVDEATTLLKEHAESVAFVLVGDRTAQWVLGEDESPEGIEIYGLCLKIDEYINSEITSMLSEKLIAGYSRATMVFFHDDKETKHFSRG